MARRKSRRGRRKGRRMSGNQAFAPSIISGTKRKRRTYRPVRKHKRRSKIGGMDNTVQTIGGVLLGVGIGMLSNKFAPESMKGKMLSAAKTLIGGGVAYAGRKNPLALGVGLGLLANGSTEAAKEFGLLQGVEEFMSGLGIGAGSDTMTIEMNGVDEIAGTPPNAGTMMSGDQFMSGSNQAMPSVIAGNEDF